MSGQSVGSLYVSLGMQTIEFDSKMDSAAARVKDATKFQAQLDTAMEGTSRSSRRVAERMIELSGAGNQFGSLISSLVRSYDVYNDRLEKVFAQHGMVAGSAVKLEAAMSALNATAKAFLPLLVLDAVAKVATYAYDTMKAAAALAEKKEFEAFLKPDADAYNGRIAGIRAEFDILHGVKTTEESITREFTKRGSIMSRYAYERLLSAQLEKEQEEKVTKAKEAAEKRGVEDIRVADKLEAELAKSKLADLDPLARKEAEINATYMERRTTAFEITDEHMRDHVIAELNAQQEKDLARARIESQEEEQKKADALDRKSEEAAEQYGKETLSAWEKIVRQAERFASLITGEGSTEEASMGSLIAGGRYAAAVASPDIGRMTGQFMQQNPTSTLDQSEVKTILQDLLDTFKQEHRF
jgi:hypothetical protein